MYIYVIYVHIQYMYILPWNQSCTEAKLSKEVLLKDSPALKFKNVTCHGVQFLAKYRNDISSQCFKMHHSTLSKIKTFVSNTKQYQYKGFFKLHYWSKMIALQTESRALILHCEEKIDYFSKCSTAMLPS